MGSKMPGKSKTCTQCRAQVSAEDSYCQECGLELANTVPLLAGFKPAQRLLSCLGCGAQYEKAMSFCGSCGSSMKESGVYTSASRFLGSKNEPAAKEADSSGNSQGSLKTKTNTAVLEPPKFKPAPKPIHFQGLPSFSAAHPPRTLVDLSVGVLLLSFFACLVWWLVDFDKAHSDFSARQSLIQARTAIGANRYDEAIQIVEKISLTKTGNLNAEERSVLNDAFNSRASINAEMKNYRLAMSDLLRITPDYPSYKEVRSKLQHYASNIELQAVNSNPGHLSERNAAQAAARGKVSASAPQLAVKSPSLKTVKPAIPTEVDTTAGSSVEQTVIVHDKDRTSRVSTRGNYMDNDVVRYNKLLADYFSVDHLSNQGSGPASDNREPPSFKEWLNQGKQDF